MCPLNGLFPSGSQIKLFVFPTQQQGKVKQWYAKAVLRKCRKISKERNRQEDYKNENEKNYKYKEDI